MKNRMPRRQELIVLAAISIICAAILGISGRYDVGLAVLGAPLFLVAALMGLRRSGEAESPLLNVDDSVRSRVELTE